MCQEKYINWHVLTGLRGIYMKRNHKIVGVGMQSGVLLVNDIIRKKKSAGVWLKGAWRGCLFGAVMAQNRAQNQLRKNVGFVPPPLHINFSHTYFYWHIHQHQARTWFLESHLLSQCGKSPNHVFFPPAFQYSCCWFTFVTAVTLPSMCWMYFCLVSFNDREDVNS